MSTPAALADPYFTPPPRDALSGIALYLLIATIATGALFYGLAVLINKRRKR